MKLSIKNRIKKSVSNQKNRDVFLASDFSSFGSRSTVAAALKSLVDEEFLVRISLGIYAKTRWNKYANGRVAVQPLSCLAPMALERLGYKVDFGKIARDLRDGKTDQIPADNVYEIGDQNITRKFSLYGMRIYYEKNGVRCED